MRTKIHVKRTISALGLLIILIGSFTASAGLQEQLVNRSFNSSSYWTEWHATIQNGYVYFAAGSDCNGYVRQNTPSISTNNVAHIGIQISAYANLGGGPCGNTNYADVTIKIYYTDGSYDYIDADQSDGTDQVLSQDGATWMYIYGNELDSNKFIDKVEFRSFNSNGYIATLLSEEYGGGII